MKNPNLYMLKIAEVVASRSTCLTRKCGAVLARDGIIISTGYNGTAKGDTNCEDGGCDRCSKHRTEALLGKNLSGQDLNECVCLHSEENAILQAARMGVKTEGSTCYSTWSPCLRCVRVLQNAGISEIVFARKYSDWQESAAKAANFKIRTTQHYG